MELGDGLRVKGEFDNDGRFQIYLIDKRDASGKWDIFPETIGVIDHVNDDKKMAHFIVDKKIEGVLRFADHTMKFHLGESVAFKLYSYRNDKGIRHNVLSCVPTDKKPGSNIVKIFNSTVRVSNGLGFTDEDVFIDIPLIRLHDIKDGDSVEGLAILNFNKKKKTWGWKAIRIDRKNVNN